MTYNINKVTDCICVWVENNSIEPRLISLTLSFGISKDLNIETPELLIGVVISVALLTEVPTIL